MEALEDFKNGSSRIGINDRRILHFCDLLGGRTLIHYCAFHRNFDVLKEIVEFIEGQESQDQLKVILNRQEQTQGRTCLHELANRKTKEEDYDGVTEMMNYLISKGGDPKVGDIQGRSVYFLAFLRKNFFLKSAFIKHNPNFFTEEATREGEGSFTLRQLYLRSHQLNMRWFDTFYQSEIIEKAIDEDDVEKLKLLVSEQVILPKFFFMRSYCSGRTFLQDIVHKKRSKILNYLLFELDGISKEKKLVKDNKEKSAFHIAVAEGSMEMVEMLLKFDESLVNDISGTRKKDILLIASMNKRKELFELLYRLRSDNSRLVRSDLDGNHFLAALVSNKWNDILRSTISEVEFGEVEDEEDDKDNNNNNSKKKIFDDLFRVAIITNNMEAFKCVESGCDEVPVKLLFQICLNSSNLKNTQIIDYIFDKYDPCKSDMAEEMIEMFVKLHSERGMLMMLEKDMKVDRLLHHIMHNWTKKLMEFVGENAKKFSTSTKSNEPRLDIFKMSYYEDYRPSKEVVRKKLDKWVKDSAPLFPLLLPSFSKEHSLGGLNPNEVLVKYFRALKRSENIPRLIKPSISDFRLNTKEVHECIKKMYTDVEMKVDENVFRYLFNTSCFELLDFLDEELLPYEVKPFIKDNESDGEDDDDDDDEEEEEEEEKKLMNDYDMDKEVFSITPDLTSLDPEKFEKLSILIARMMPEVYLNTEVLKKACTRRRDVLAGYIILNMDNDCYKSSFSSEIVNRSLSDSIHRVVTVYMENEVLKTLDLPHLIYLSFLYLSPETAMYLLKFMKEEGMDIDHRIVYDSFVKYDFKEGVRYMIDEKYGLETLIRCASKAVEPRSVLQMISEEISVFVDEIGGSEVLKHTSYRHDLMLECLKCLYTSNNSKGEEMNNDAFNTALGVFFTRKYSSITKGECHMSVFAKQVKKYQEFFKGLMDRENLVLDHKAFSAILEREEVNFLLSQLGPDRFPTIETIEVQKVWRSKEMELVYPIDLWKVEDEKLSVSIFKKYKEFDYGRADTSSEKEDDDDNSGVEEDDDDDGEEKEEEEEKPKDETKCFKGINMLKRVLMGNRFVLKNCHVFGDGFRLIDEC